jgi:hypothetical protein
MAGVRGRGSGVRKDRDLPWHLRPKARRHHNNEGRAMLKSGACFQRLERFCRKYGLRLAGAEEA